MQAVILAGGLGTRLWPLTKEVPKPMVQVAGAPYLEHQLRLLKQQQIDILILTGYLGGQIEDYFGDGGRLGLSIRYSREPAPIGTGGALRQAGAMLASEFLVIYGDSLLPIDYREAIGGLVRAEGVVVVYDNRLSDTSVSNNIALDDDGFVCRYDKETREDPRLTHVDAGVLAFRRAVLERIPQNGVVSLEKEVYPELITLRQLFGHQTRQRFFDIGTPERLRTIEKYLLHDHHPNSV